MVKHSSGCSILFGEIAGEWMADVLESHKYSTYVKYKQLYDKYLSDLLGVKLWQKSIMRLWKIL